MRSAAARAAAVAAVVVVPPVAVAVAQTPVPADCALSDPLPSPALFHWAGRVHERAPGWGQHPPTAPRGGAQPGTPVPGWDQQPLAPAEQQAQQRREAQPVLRVARGVCGETHGVMHARRDARCNAAGTSRRQVRS